MAEKLNLLEKLQSDRKFSSFVKALIDSGFAGTLTEETEYTVLAPTNEAFKKVPVGTLDDLAKPENIEKFAELMKYHILSGKVTSEEITKLQTVKTLQGQEIKIAVSNSGINLDDSRMHARNIKTINGLIHAIDGLLIPTVAAAKMA